MNLIQRELHIPQDSLCSKNDRVFTRSETAEWRHHFIEENIESATADSIHHLP